MSFGKDNGAAFVDRTGLVVLDLDNVRSFHIGIFKDQRGSTEPKNLPPKGNQRESNRYFGAQTELIVTSRLLSK